MDTFDLEQSRKQIIFEAQRSAVYHQDRRKHFDNIGKATKFLLIACGTASVVSTIEILGFKHIFELVIVVLACAELVYDYSGRARTHEILQREFFSIAAEAAKIRTSGEEDLCREIESRLYKLYAEEPPIMHAVNAVAYNHTIMSLSQEFPERDLIKISWLQRKMRNFFVFGDLATQLKNT